MDIQQVAPWVSLLASILTFVYVGLREWRRVPGNDGAPAQRRNRPSLGEIVASADLFLMVAISMLFMAAVAHYLLSLTPASFLVVPVWLLALFVVVVVGLIQTMPGETFEEKVERFTERLGSDIEAGSDVEVDISVENREDSPTDADE
jgi:NADH:ubiquinone oxidoreductase subunit 6 (subunit J)